MSSTPIDTGLATAYRIPHYSANLPFLVAWSQKAGCTSVLKWFFFHINLLDEATEYCSTDVGLDVHDYEMRVFKAGPEYRASVISQLQAGTLLINFVRCPFERAFSSYMHLNNRFYINQERKGIDSPGIQVRRSVLRSVYDADVSVEYPVSFLDYLQWLEQQDLYQLERHHAPQHSEIYHYGNIRHYRLEDFAAATQSLEREFGLQASTADKDRFSAGHHTSKVEVPRDVALRLLEKSIPLNASPNFKIPKVNRTLLEGTCFESIISRLFCDDIALHDSLAQPIC